eukprot:Ihof_evm5s602 gene=Ihof_evmTU5s602
MSGYDPFASSSAPSESEDTSDLPLSGQEQQHTQPIAHIYPTTNYDTARMWQGEAPPAGHVPPLDITHQSNREIYSEHGHPQVAAYRTTSQSQSDYVPSPASQPGYSYPPQNQSEYAPQSQYHMESQSYIPTNQSEYTYPLQSGYPPTCQYPPQKQPEWDIQGQYATRSQSEKFSATTVAPIPRPQTPPLTSIPPPRPAGPPPVPNHNIILSCEGIEWNTKDLSSLAFFPLLKPCGLYPPTSTFNNEKMMLENELTPLRTMLTNEYNERNMDINRIYNMGVTKIKTMATVNKGIGMMSKLIGKEQGDRLQQKSEREKMLAKENREAIESYYKSRTRVYNKLSAGEK